MQDQVIFFHRNGKPGYRFLTGPLRKAKKEKEASLIKIQGNHGDSRWMHKCSQCGLHFFEDEDSRIKETGICKKCRENEPELELDHDDECVSMTFYKEK